MKGQDSIAFCITSDYNSIREKDVFSDLLKVLMAYAFKLIGDSTLRLSKNKSDLAYDLAMDAIRMHLENPDRFDPTRNPDLVKYLKYNLLRRIISNHKELKGQQNEVLYEQQDSNGIIVNGVHVEELDFHDSIDLDNCVALIHNEVKDKFELKQLFELRYIKDYSRSEIIAELNLSQGEYNNRIRRLDTIRKKIINSQQIEV